MPPEPTPYAPTDALLSPLEERATRLLEASSPLDGLHAGRQLALRLDRALGRLRTPAPPRKPFTVVLLGGTGVGKSTLYNTLIGRPDASPASDSVRCFTKQPFVAVRPEDKPLVVLPDGLDPQWVDISETGIALIDTPDIDGMLATNHEVTRAAVEAGDLIVYVTFPDKQADEAVLRELRHWAGQKRWFFVLTKIDLYKDHDAIRASFDRRLTELGFPIDDRVRFLVSSTDPTKFDFPRLREAIMRPRPEEMLLLLRHDSFLAQLAEAGAEEVTKPLEVMARELRKREAELMDRVRVAYAEGLRTPEAGETARSVVGDATWRHASGRCGPFMAVPIWVRNRMNVLLGGYSANRLLRVGGVVGLAGAAASMVMATARGLAPLKEMIEALGPGFGRALAEVQADARRELEDRRIERLVPGLYPETKEVAPKNPGTADPVQAAFDWIDKTMNRYILANVDAEVLRNLSADVERIGRRTAAAAFGGGFGRLVVWTANLIPTAMLGWILYRIGMGWYGESYYRYGYEFYLMSVGLLVASLIPGYLAISARVRGRVRALDTQVLVRDIDEVKATAALRTAADALEAMARQARELNRSATAMRDELNFEIAEMGTKSRG